jgi:hypothetical protein
VNKSAVKTMRKPAPGGKKPAAYPVETNGAKWAAENRKKASALSEREREALFKRGVIKIYGRQAVCAGR